MTTVLVIHAKHLTDRRKHIEHQLAKWPGDIFYILDADKNELTDEIVHTYFKEGCELDNKSGATSCAMKHLLACKYIVEHQLEGALVLEDDIVLHSNFCNLFEKTLEEYRLKYSDQPILISYEDSSLQFIPRSNRVKGQWLYKAPQGRVRFTGALYYSSLVAQAILAEVKTNKCDIAIDHFQTRLYKNGKITILWCEPCIATQGSFTGIFSSSIGQLRFFEGLRWRIKYAYKRLVYWFR